MTAAEQVSPPVLDLAAVREHLVRYIGAPGMLSVVSDLDWTGDRFPCTPDGIELAVETVRDLDVQGAHGIYCRGTTMRPNAPRYGRGRAEDSVSVLQLQLDVDYGKPGYAPDAATAFTLTMSAPVPPPSRWVASGHGLYPVWDLVEPTPHSPFIDALVTDLHAAVSATFTAAGYRIDPGVTDSARVWRIPGTVNRKDDEHPVPCAVAVGVGSGKPHKVTTLRRSIASAPPAVRPEGRADPGSVPLSDRRYTLGEARVYAAEQALVPLSHATDGHRNKELNDAAVVFGHFVGGGFLKTSDAVEALLAACPPGWDEPVKVRTSTIMSGLRKGMTEPYTLVVDDATLMSAPVAEPTTPPASNVLQPGPAPIDLPTAPAEPVPVQTPAASDWSASGALDAGVQVALMKLRATQRAREILAAEDAEPLRVLRGLEFLRAPQPEYLVPSMLYRASTAKVFGPPGSTKSFLLMDVALSLATGRPFHGNLQVPRTRVHYVMAEGQAINVTRALAWLHHHQIAETEIDGWFDAIPQGVLLTPAGVESYLQVVEQDRPGLVILDTKNAMMDGDENHASDVAVMVRAMRAIRDVSDACVALVDHTGINDTARGRGSNAVTAAMDTEIKVEVGEGGVATACVTRDKGAEVGATWAYTLRKVDGVPGIRPGSKPPAVCHPVNAPTGDDAPFQRSREWWQHDTQVPLSVALLSGDGADCARDIYRVLWFMREHDEGVSMAVIRRAIGARPKAKEPSEATARRGRVLLEEAKVVHAISKGSYALTPTFADGKDTPS